MRAEPREVPDEPWDVRYYQDNNLYFHLVEITEVLPDSARVITKDRGEMIMFGSYSYLGLISHPLIDEAAKNAVARFGTGTHGVRLLAGTLSIHNQLESKIAIYKGTQASLVFSSGYAANISTISALLRRRDVVICDKLDHASIVDGCILSGAKFLRFQHNSMKHLEAQLKKASEQGSRKLVIVDAVFSMDGDIAHLPEVKQLCVKYGALLMVDEAHSLGVLGSRGRGIEEHFGMPPDTIDIKMGTLSKAIPSVGGYVAGSFDLIEALRHKARGFVYSAALPPASAAAALQTLDIMEREPERVERLRRNYNYFLQSLRESGFNLLQSETPIAPIICGTEEKATRLMMHCVEKGIFVQAILPPVVSKGRARLRATVTASHTIDEIDYFVDVVKEGAIKLGVL